MDAQHFDRLTRSLATTTGRRGALRLLGGGALGAALAKLGLGRAAAQEAASRDEGDACTRSRQCRGALRCCNGRCRDVLNNDNRCGNCDTPCGKGERCRNGACFRSCRGARAGVCDTNECGNLCGCNATTGAGVCESLRGSCGAAQRCREPADCPKGLVCVDEGCCDGKPRVCARPCGTRDTRFETASDDGPTRVPVEAEPAAAPGPETPD